MHLGLFYVNRLEVIPEKRDLDRLCQIIEPD